MGRMKRNFTRWLRGRKARRHGGGSFLYEPANAPKRRNEGFAIPRRYVFLAMMILLAVLFARGFYRFDRLILPLVLEAEELRIQAEINNVINSVVNEIIMENNVTAADFIMQNDIVSNGFSKPVLSVNTVLVNEICNAAAQAISERLNNLEPEIISVPLGMIFGLDTLAQVGPRFSFYMAPVGNALVNYASSFIAVGINQTHFSVWLEVESIVRIVNPVQSAEVVVTRQVSLVDTIISGTVPGTYLNMDAPVLNLPN
jgi:sporulation protein YunB